MTFLLLVLGLVLLIKGADFLVDSASKLAALFGIPPFIIGLTIVAIGTSAPEATIGIFSAVKSANQITLGDAVGSSIVNILLVLGITMSILPLKVDRFVARREIPLSFIVQSILAVMIITGFVVTRIEGGLLFAGFTLFITLLVLRSLRKAKKDGLTRLIEKECDLPGLTCEKDKKKTESVPWLVFLFFVGLAGLVFGGNLVVDNAVAIAVSLGLSKEFIGLTVVALGTSLPELVTCVVAAVKKNEEIAIGNIIGSNIFNVLFVLGLSALINPIQAKPDILIDTAIMIVATVILFVPSFFRGRLSRMTGSLFILTYVAYITYKVSSLGIPSIK